MTELHLDHFMSAARDFESAQYRVMHGLQHARHAFARNVVYPHLSSLMRISGTLKKILGGMDEVSRSVPKRIKDIDWEAHKIRYDFPELEDDKLAEVKALIDWAQPHMGMAIEEGQTICEFVEENLQLDEVGIVPAYVEEGYLMIPNRSAQQLYVLKYSLSIFSDVKERYRSLRTALIKTIPTQGIEKPPNAIKIELLNEFRDMPNPATFMCDVAIDFPFEETILPIAKRKLMRRLFMEQGSA